MLTRRVIATGQLRTYTYDYRNRLTAVDDSPVPAGAAAAATITPNINSSAVTYFDGGGNVPAGQYLVGYLGGSLQFSTGFPYQVNGGGGFQVTFDNGTNVEGPGNGTTYGTAAAAEAGNAGAYVLIDHRTDGPIGMFLQDNPYADNSAGADGSPRFELVVPNALPVHVRYGYDASNRRVTTSVLDTATGQYDVTERYYYDGSDLVLVTDGAGDVASRYLYGPTADGNDQALAADAGPTTAAGPNAAGPQATRWYVSDRKGTVTDVLGADGVEVDHLTYDTFGNVVAQTGPAERPRFGFQGMESDDGVAAGASFATVSADTGMDYDNARFYDSGTGRFLNQDPLGLSAGDPNVYRFVGNDPTGATDPTGTEVAINQGGGAGASGGSFDSSPSNAELTDDSEADAAGGDGSAADDIYNPANFYLNKQYDAKSAAVTAWLNQVHAQSAARAGVSVNAPSDPAAYGSLLVSGLTVTPPNPIQLAPGVVTPQMEYQQQHPLAGFQTLAAGSVAQSPAAASAVAGLAQNLSLPFRPIEDPDASPYLGKSAIEHLFEPDWLDALDWDPETWGPAIQTVGPILAGVVAPELDLGELLLGGSEALDAADVASQVGTIDSYSLGAEADTSVDLGTVFCFRPGTTVLAGSGDRRPIEQVGLGRRVATPEASAERPANPITQATHRVIRLRTVRDGQELRMSFLRPASLIGHLGRGDTVHVDIFELGVKGPAEVLGVEPSPEIEEGPGRIVTGVCAGDSVDVYQVHLVGLREPLEVTGNHPLFSEDHQKFVSAKVLGPGNRLRTADGAGAIVERMAKLNARLDIRNLEVDGTHQFYVTALDVLAHNANNGQGISGDAISTRIDVNVPGRPDPAWSIDTSSFTEGVETANGGIRNRSEFWNQWIEQQPGTISPSNAYRIQELDLSPKIDDTWLNSFPEHSGFSGDTLIHHHVGQGPYAIPVPSSTHVGFGPPWH